MKNTTKYSTEFSGGYEWMKIDGEWKYVFRARGLENKEIRCALKEK